MISHAEDLPIRPKDLKYPGLHYFIWDKKGNFAVVDFIEGRAVVSSDNALTVSLLTNSECSLSVNSWKNKKIPAKDTGKSITRFISAADQISNASPTTIQEARDLIKNALLKTPLSLTIGLLWFDPNVQIYFLFYLAIWKEQAGWMLDWIASPSEQIS